MFFIEGFFIGLTTLFLVGPVVFILVNATVKNGLKAGFSVAIGIFISDLIYALLSINGLSYILKNSILDKYLSIIGFVLLLSFGINYLLKKVNANNSQNGNSTNIQNFITGFSINFFNPR